MGGARSQAMAPARQLVKMHQDTGPPHHPYLSNTPSSHPQLHLLCFVCLFLCKQPMCLCFQEVLLYIIDASNFCIIYIAPPGPVLVLLLRIYLSHGQVPLWSTSY